MQDTIKKFAAQLAKARTPFKESKRVRLDDPKMQVYWERLAEDLLRTEAEWDELIANSHRESHAQREKVLAKARTR